MSHFLSFNESQILVRVKSEHGGSAMTMHEVWHLAANLGPHALTCFASHLTLSSRRWELPYRCIFSLLRKPIETSDCKGSWTPPWTARPMKPSGIVWLWKKPQHLWAKGEASRGSAWRTAMRKMRKMIRPSVLYSLRIESCNQCMSLVC